MLQMREDMIALKTVGNCDEVFSPSPLAASVSPHRPGEVKSAA